MFPFAETRVRNCNHFTEELAYRLTGRSIPAWINRLSGIVDSVKCCIPAGYLPKGPQADGLAIPQPTTISGDDEEGVMLDEDVHIPEVRFAP